MSGTRSYSLAWIGILGLCAPLGAEPARVRGENPRASQLFAEIVALESEKRWLAVLDRYQQLIDLAGDDLVPAEDDPDRWIPVRRKVLERIAARPELLKPYRERIDERARQLWTRGLAERDPHWLREAVDLHLGSSTSAACWHALGDWACERGEIEQARSAWAQAGRVPRLPGESTDAEALARAKAILADLLQGRVADARLAATAFRQDFPTAQGHLAGQSGRLVDRLDALLKDPERWKFAPARELKRANSFAVDAARGGTVHGALPAQSPKPRYGAIALPGAAPWNFGQIQARPVLGPAALAFHPLLAWGQILVADPAGVQAYEFATGRPGPRFELAAIDRPLSTALETRLPTRSEVRHTLQLAGDRVIARLGDPRIGGGRSEPGSYLVCLHWQKEAGEPGRWRLVWALPPPRDVSGRAMTFWEGVPVVREGRLLAAYTRLDASREVGSIASFDLEDPAPGPIWTREVYEKPLERVDRTRHHLLTVSGSRAVLCTHAGVIVAVDADSGRRAWATRYPRRGELTSTGEVSPRDLVPCLALGGRVLAAPADAEQVFCLDLETGRRLWASGTLEVAHLLGAASNRLIVALGGFHSGLAALDLESGRRIPDWGYRVAGADALAPLGRGVVLEDRVIWPTRAAGLRELFWDGTTRYPPPAFQEMPGGNLAVGPEGVVVASAERLHVLAQSDANEPRAAVPWPWQALSRLDASATRLTLARAEDDYECMDATASAPQRPDRDFGIDPRPRWRLPVDWERAWPILVEGEAPVPVLFGQPGGARCVDPWSGQVLWQTSLGFHPVWALGLGEDYLLAGPSGMARVGHAGRLAWSRRVGRELDAVPPGWQDRESIVPGPEFLGRPRRIGTRVVARLGADRLRAFALADGQTCWEFPSRALGSAALQPLRLGPRWLADAQGLVVQSLDGRRWAIDPESGAAWASGPAPRDPWPDPPLRLDAERVLVVEDGALTAWQPRTGRTVWRWEIPGWPSLTGTLPRVAREGERILAGVERNDGLELHGLDAATGKPNVPRPLWLGNVTMEWSGVMWDEGRVGWFQGEDVLFADWRSRPTIERIPLGVGSGWRVERWGSSWWCVTRPATRAWERPTRAGAIVLLSRDEGKAGVRLARLDFPNFGARGQARRVGNAWVVVTDDAVCGFQALNGEAK